MHIKNVMALLNPCSIKYHACERFKDSLNTKQKTAVVALTVLVAVVTFGLLATLIFRCLVKKYSLTATVKGELPKPLEFDSLRKSVDFDGLRKSSAEDIQRDWNDAMKNEDLVKAGQLLKSGFNINVQDGHGNTPLMSAVKNKNIKAVQFLLENNADRSIKNFKGYLPIHAAAAKGQLDLLKLLIDQKAVHEKGLEGMTALHIAIYHNHQAVVDYLLEQGADLTLQTNHESLPFHFAAQAGNLDIFKKVFTDEMDINARGASGRTALSFAIDSKNLEVVQYLLDRGADRTMEDTEGGDLPLHRAAREGLLEIVKVLVDPATINIKNSHGWTALHGAIHQNRPEVVDYLLEQGADLTLQTNHGSLPFHFAAQAGNLDLFKKVFTDEMDINAKGAGGRTALSFAIDSKNLEVVQYLLDIGADRTMENAKGELPLHMAASDGLLEIVKVLVDPATINIQNPHGWTALHAAIDKKHPEVMDYLLEQGADKTIESRKGNSSLHLAISRGNLDMVKKLIDQDTINQQGAKGMTALNIAIACNDLTVASYLIENGADSSIANNQGSLPFHFAAQKGYLNILNQLYSESMDINVKGDGGMTAISFAAEANHLHVVKFLLEKGADPLVVSEEGFSALDYAKSAGHEAMIKLLENHLEK